MPGFLSRGARSVVSRPASARGSQSTTATAVASPGPAESVETDPRLAAPMLDCQVPYVDEYPRLCNGAVRQASEYSACIPQADFATWSCLRLDAAATLCPSEAPFRMTVLLENDDVAFDCASQRIVHEGSPARPGIRAPKTRSVSGISISNCTIEGTGHSGIELGRNHRGTEVSTPRGHSDITIRNVTIERSGYGVYIGPYSRNIVLQQVRVRSARTVGVYVDAGSLGTRLEHVEVVGTRRREGIAIDSASQTTVVESLTRGNAGAGIRLYHNCGELRGTVCPVRRALGASGNVIERNRIEDGLVIASRQGENYSASLCSDLDGRAGASRDEARNNRIVNNTFVAPERWASLSIHDGPNELRGNRFTTRQGSEQCLGLHLEPRAHAGGDVPNVSFRGTVLAQNDFGTCEVRLREVDTDDLELETNFGHGGRCNGLDASCAARPGKR